MASFCRVDSLAGRLPSMLSALEEHDFLFQLHLNDMPQDDSNEVQTCLCALHTICYTVFISDFILVVNSLFSVFHVVIRNSVKTLLKRRLFILSQTKSCNPNCDT